MALSVASAIACPAASDITPTPGRDPRLQTVVYDADQVVRLGVATGYQLSIELAPGERIENVALGNAAAWQASANRRGDRLFIKPLVEGVATNMTVVSDLRSYVFTLEPLSFPDPAMAYSVRFLYPTVPAAASPRLIGRYRLSGDRALAPMDLADDGLSTTFAWPADAALPVVVLIEAGGRERLADVAFRDGRYVIDDVVPALRFRRGGLSLTATRLAPGEAP